MPDNDITVTPQNSPYPIPSPTANYGTVTLRTGGFLAIETQTTVTIRTLTTS
jgi:hypothetical protein